MQRISTQMSFFFKDEEADKNDTTSTFVDNLSLPIHRWFRYSAGFSALWVRELIEQEKVNGRHRVLDPFAGSGTVLLEGEFCDVNAIGTEAHPLVARVARAKLCWRENPKAFRDYALSILEQAKKHRTEASEYPLLVEKCFSPEALSALDSLRKAWKTTADGSSFSELAWLALTSILRDCSPVGTAQWQYVLPNKTKAKVVDPYKAFEAKIYLMSHDMTTRQMQSHGSKAALYQQDARECDSVPDGWADLVITSPPYSNNYDYADATRLEMSFFGEIHGWGDLQDAVRKYLVRSCTQHVATLVADTYSITADPLLDSIRNDLVETCKLLEAEREKHGGKKPYHTMIAAYFQDMAKVWTALRRVTDQGALVCFVVGDSAPYGMYVPVDKWLGELAVAAGFRSYTFEKTRDRNIKWKNRKHRVPLHEGHLWVER
jgi:DNA modification methylase